MASKDIDPIMHPRVDAGVRQGEITHPFCELERAANVRLIEEVSDGATHDLSGKPEPSEMIFPAGIIPAVEIP